MSKITNVISYLKCDVTQVWEEWGLLFENQRKQAWESSLVATKPANACHIKSIFNSKAVLSTDCKIGL